MGEVHGCANSFWLRRWHGISLRTYYCWRQRYDPALADDARRVEQLQAEIDRLKRRVAELMLDKQMLQDVAKKRGDRHLE